MSGSPLRECKQRIGIVITSSSHITQVQQSSMLIDYKNVDLNL